MILECHRIHERNFRDFKRRLQWKTTILFSQKSFLTCKDKTHKRVFLEVKNSVWLSKIHNTLFNWICTCSKIRKRLLDQQVVLKRPELFLCMTKYSLKTTFLCHIWLKASYLCVCVCVHIQKNVKVWMREAKRHAKIVLAQISFLYHVEYQNLI